MAGASSEFTHHAHVLMFQVMAVEHEQPLVVFEQLDNANKRCRPSLLPCQAPERRGIAEHRLRGFFQLWNLAAGIEHGDGNLALLVQLGNQFVQFDKIAFQQVLPGGCFQALWLDVDSGQVTGTK